MNRYSIDSIISPTLAPTLSSVLATCIAGRGTAQVISAYYNSEDYALNQPFVADALAVILSRIDSKL